MSRKNDHTLALGRHSLRPLDDEALRAVAGGIAHEGYRPADGDAFGVIIRRR